MSLHDLQAKYAEVIDERTAVDYLSRRKPGVREQGRIALVAFGRLSCAHLRRRRRTFAQDNRPLHES